MFSTLKVKSNQFFSNNSLSPETYQNAKNYKEKRLYYLLSIAHNIEEPQKVIEFIISLQQKKIFDEEIFLSVVWGISLQVANLPQEFNKIAELVTLLYSKSLIQKSKLIQNLPESIISKSNVMEQQQIDKKLNRAYTKTFLQQNKYSLIKENNQGYSKLLLFLTNLTDQLNSEEVWSKILSLVGKFDLDPDRVLDLIVESQLLNVNKRIYTNLIQKFKGQSIATILANKISKVPQKKVKSLVFAGYFQSFLKTSTDEIYRKSGQIPNPTLIKLIAQLICKSIIQISDIEKALEPSDTSLQQINYKRIKNGQQRLMKSFKICLQELDKQQKNAVFHQDNNKFMGQLLYSSKLALYTEFLKFNEWKIFQTLWEKYKSTFDLMLYQPLLANLLALIQWSIQPVYEKISFSRFLKTRNVQTQKFCQKENGVPRSYQVNDQFFTNLLHLLSYAKDYIGFKHSLLIKLTRIFKAIKKSQLLPTSGETTKFQQESIQYIVKSYIVPGIGYQMCNPSLGNEVYAILELYPYQFRYECYLQVYKNKLTHNPYSAKMFQHLKVKQNIIVNNLSNNNKKQFVKKLAKLTHNHALQVMYWIVRRLLKEDYESVIPQIISALNNATHLTLEQTVFLMIFYLNQHHEPAVKLKTAQFQPWYKNIIMFLSLFYRKYLEVDLQPVFDFVIKKTSQQIRQLQDNEEIPGGYIKLLHELLNKMLGSFIIEDVNKAKYQILSSGPRLQIQLLYLTSEIRAAKKSKHTLQEFFWDKTSSHFQNNTLAFNLLVLLSQKRAQFMHKTYIDNLKIVGDTYDDFTTLIIQLVRVLNYQATDYSRYFELLPQNAANVLMNRYKIPIQIVFQIIRPSVKHVAKMNQSEWKALKTQIQNSFLNYIKNQDYAIRGYCDDNVKTLFQNYKSNLNELLPINLFCSFWFLTLDSIYFPDKLYTEKIQDLRKKIDPIQNKKSDKTQKNDRQFQKIKNLFEKIKKEEEIQKQKFTDTLSPQNLKRLEVPFLKTANQQQIANFAEAFVQICLLPRLLLDPREAIYSMKFTILFIKANKMSSSKSIRILTFIIEFVMNYLPYSTKRQAQNCLATFLSQILGIFSNWNQPAKLKQDMKFYLDIEDLKDNYQKLRQYLLKLFERVGNLIKSITEEPYIIKNCLYLLQKVDAIPGYKQQAQQLENHMKQLRQVHSTVDMKTILDMQIAILGAKRIKLSGKPDDKNSMTIQNVAPQVQLNSQKIKNIEVANGKPEVYLAMQKQKEKREQRFSKQRERQKLSKQKQREKSYQRESKDNQRKRDSKDRLYKQKQSQLQKQKQKLSKDREKQIKNKDLKPFKQTEKPYAEKSYKQTEKSYKQAEKPYRQAEKPKQRQQRKSQKQIKTTKISEDRQKIDNYKPSKIQQESAKFRQKRVIKVQQRQSFSKHNNPSEPTNQSKEVVNMRAQKAQKYDKQPTNEKFEKEPDVDIIKPSTMTVKQRRELQAQQQLQTSKIDVNPPRIQTQLKVTNQVHPMEDQQKLQTKTNQQEKNQKSSGKNLDNKNKQPHTRILNQKTLSPPQSIKESQPLPKVLDSSQFPQNSSKIINQSLGNSPLKNIEKTSLEGNKYSNKDNQQNKPQKAVNLVQQIKIGPKKQILQRFTQNQVGMEKETSTDKLEDNIKEKIQISLKNSDKIKDLNTTNNLVPLNSDKTTIIQKEVNSKSKSQEDKNQKFQRERQPQLIKQTSQKQKDYKDKQTPRDLQLKGNLKEQRQKDNYKQDRRKDYQKDQRQKEDKYTHNKKDNFRDSRDRSQFKKEKQQQKTNYNRDNRQKDFQSQQRDSSRKEDYRERQRKEDKNRQDFKYNREKDEKRERQDKRDRQDKRERSQKRDKEDRRQKDNRDHSKNKYNEKDQRRHDTERQRKADKKHNRSRSRQKHHSRR